MRRARSTVSLSSSDSSDDVLEVFISLQNTLHFPGHVVMILAHNALFKHTGCGLQRVDGRIDAHLNNGAGEVGGGIKVCKGGGHGRVCVVVGGHIDRLDGGDGA